MKKVFFVFALLGLLVIIPETSKAVTQPDCYSVIITCPDGTQHGWMVCDWEDLQNA